MIKSLVHKILLKRSKKQPKSATVVRANLVSAIAVIAVHNDQDFNVAHEYVKELRNKGIKQVDFYIGFKNKRFMELFNPTLKDFLFHPKSFSWNAGFLSPELRQAATREYELLIDLSEGRLTEADVVVSKLKAKWKAGRFHPKRKFLFDFMIEGGQADLRNLIHHIENYLMNFNKTTAA